eukprot:1144187-Pelagomonas_calceolata.AAC.3
MVAGGVGGVVGVGGRLAGVAMLLLCVKCSIEGWSGVYVCVCVCARTRTHVRVCERASQAPLGVS